MGGLRRLTVAVAVLALACASESEPAGALEGPAEAGERPMRRAVDIAGRDAVASVPRGFVVGGEPGAEDEPSREDTDARQPTNVSFETARRVTTDGHPVLQDEVSADQVDFFVFSGQAGAYYELSTDRHRFSPNVMMALFDADRNLIAQNDDGSIWPRDGIDARLVVRLPDSGDYYVRVEDPWTPQEFFELSSFPLLYYHLKIREIEAATPGFVREEQGEAPAELQVDDATGIAYVTLLGQFGAQDDAFALHGQSDAALVAKVLPAGLKGNGSTARGGQLRVIDSEDHTLAHIDRSEGQAELHPPLADELYQVTVESHDEEGGVNAFYAVDLVMVADNPRERSEAQNGTLEGAEPILLEGGVVRRGRVLSMLPEGDVDYFRFSAQAGELVSLVCDAESRGSSVRGLNAELRDEADDVVMSAEELASEHLFVENIELPVSGTYYLRLSAETPPGAVEPWVRCAITSSP